MRFALALRSKADVVAADDSARPDPGPDLPDAARLVTIGAAIIVGFFGFLGGWAAVSPLESAAITYGVVGAEGSRKAVQHFDGGVVRAILVREGDLVTEGQEIILLDDVQARASLQIQSAAVDTQTAVIARLEAEAAKTDAIAFPAALTEKSASDPAIRDLLGSQEELFTARRTALAAQVATIREQIRQAESQIVIYRGQAETAEHQYRMVNEELAPKQMLYDKGYATNSPVMQLKRAATALLGQKDEYTGHITRLEHSLAQLERQIAQIESDQRVKVAQELEDARNKLSDARERERVARDTLDRTTIRAPVTGHVLGMTVNTIGGVVGRGERLLEIVPANAALTIKAKLNTAEGAEVHEGMPTEIRVLSSQGRALPMIRGTVRNRSADARTDAATSALYYDIDVAIDADDLRGIDAGVLQPGTPVEVIVPTGSRTALTYLVEPISESLRHAMREK